MQKPIQRQKTRTAKTMMVGSLEFVVGVIFVFGVAALFYFSTKRTLDTILGGIHMGFGVATFPVVYGVLKARSFCVASRISRTLPCGSALSLLLGLGIVHCMCRAFSFGAAVRH